jgi:hypothetical protein
MLRLIEVGRDDREKLVPEISVAKNRQSPIRGRDLFAWDLSQQRLKKEFERLGYFFETREREWEAFSKQRADAHSLFPNGRLVNTDSARAFLAVHLQDPFRAKHRKKEFFQHEQEGGVFERIFKETAAEQLLLSHNIYQFVYDQCKKAGKVFRTLSTEAEQRPLTEEDEFRLEEANVVWNGDAYLASLIGFFLGRYYGIPLQEDEDLSLTQHLLNQIPSPKSSQILELLFDFAREITIQTYLFGKRSYKTPRLYAPRRFYYQEDTFEFLTEQARAKSTHTLSGVLAPFRGKM